MVKCVDGVFWVDIDVGVVVCVVVKVDWIVVVLLYFECVKLVGYFL